MAEIHKSATIDAPAERVFDLLDDPSGIPSYTPNVERVEDVRRSEQRVGDTFRVIYKVVGMTFEEMFTVTEHVRPTRLASRFDGGHFFPGARFSARPPFNTLTPPQTRVKRQSR